jgi:hypothetical protein
MTPLHVAARFTAFAAYLNADSELARSPEEAGRFVREYWEGFLPLVDEELARFLTMAPRARKAKAAGYAPVARAVRQHN